MYTNKTGNVKLTPKILKNSQEFIFENTIFSIVLILHSAGSGSMVEEIEKL